MRVFTTVPQENLRLVPEAARAAETERYDGIISMENKHDPFLALAVAGVGPAMLKVAAEECDGVRLHGFCTRQYLTDEIMPRIETGLAKAGRQREQYEISGGGFLATGPDDASVAKRFEWVRQRVAFYG